MREELTISVLLPVYNGAAHLKQAIDSLLDQTLTSFELIIIDDCSTDDTIELIQSYNDQRIRLVRKPVKTGLIASLNMGLDLAKAPFIARMDADDICFPDRFEKQVAFLKKHTDVDICGGAYQVIGTEELVYFPASHEEIKFYALEFCPIAHPTVMFRKCFLDKHGLRYAPDFEGAEDYELWTRSIWLGKFANLNDILLAYRRHSGQFSSTNRTNQLANSLRCRLNMLVRVYRDAAIRDPLTLELLGQREVFSVPLRLSEIMGRLNEVTRVNREYSYYPPSLFDPYLRAHQQHIMRRYFLNQAKYHPGILKEMVTAWPPLKNGFSIVEYLKIGLKSLVCWR